MIDGRETGVILPNSLTTKESVRSMLQNLNVCERTMTGTLRAEAIKISPAVPHLPIIAPFNTTASASTNTLVT